MPTARAVTNAVGRTISGGSVFAELGNRGLMESQAIWRPDRRQKQLSIPAEEMAQVAKDTWLSTVAQNMTEVGSFADFLISHKQLDPWTMCSVYQRLPAKQHGLDEIPGHRVIEIHTAKRRYQWRQHRCYRLR